MENIIVCSGIVKESIVDGTGIRYVIFLQGCPHRCAGCHNPNTHAFEGGKPYTVEEILADIKKNPLLSGVTLSGGEPFSQPRPLSLIAQQVKASGMNIWTYSGYTYEELLSMAKEDEYVKLLLNYTDVLVDGRFILDQKSLMLKFRGSKNQRVIDINKTRQAGEIVLLYE